jgi:hypothetical protein
MSTSTSVEIKDIKIALIPYGGAIPEPANGRTLMLISKRFIVHTIVDSLTSEEVKHFYNGDTYRCVFLNGVIVSCWRTDQKP